MNYLFALLIVMSPDVKWCNYNLNINRIVSRLPISTLIISSRPAKKSKIVQSGFSTQNLVLNLERNSRIRLHPPAHFLCFEIAAQFLHYNGRTEHHTRKRFIYYNK